MDQPTQELQLVTPSNGPGRGADRHGRSAQPVGAHRLGDGRNGGPITPDEGAGRDSATSARARPRDKGSERGRSLLGEPRGYVSGRWEDRRLP